MYKMQKIISIVLILTIITSILLSIINQNKSYAVTQSTSTDINSIDDSKYPGIKERIKLLKSKYPNWNFKILYTKEHGYVLYVVIKHMTMEIGDVYLNKD